MKWIVAIYGLFLVYIIASVNTGTGEWLLYLSENVPGRDKTCHFFLIGTLALIINLLFNNAAWWWGRIPWLKGSVLVFLLVAAEEGTQIFLSRRCFSLGDLASDIGGIAVLGSLALCFDLPRKSVK